MKWERLLLIAFLGNYLINNVVAALVSLIPSSGAGYFTPQYITFVILALISTALITWWYFAPMLMAANERRGAIFGIGGFVISILTTFVSGVAGVLAQSGSFSQVIAVLPNFGPFLWNWSTLILFLYWVIPSALVGWYLHKRMHRDSARVTTSTSM